MNDLFNKPILDQMYEFRKEDFEKAVYDKDNEIAEIEEDICNLGEELSNILKKVIPNKKDYEKVFDHILKYELSFGNEIDF